jgi:hypothetical protein
MSWEEKLPKGYHWQGFLGGSFNNTLNLAKIVQSRASVHNHTKIIPIKYYDRVLKKKKTVHGVALKPKEKY